MARAIGMAELLQEISRTPEGKLRLIQVIACTDEGLSTPADVADFFGDLLRHCQATGSTAKWAEGWDKVARGCSPHVPRPGGHVRRMARDRAPPPPAAALTTVINEDDWRTYHVRGSEGAGLDVGLPLPKYPIERDGKLARRWEEFLRTEPWIKPTSPDEGAWLGRPATHKANCWVSCAKLATEEPDERQHGDLEDLLDALGLPAKQQWAWIRYTIHPARLVADAGSSSALGVRPGFADLGSPWFRVESSGEAARRHRRNGWGSTVNLAEHRKAGPGGRHPPDDTGLPERVMPAVRVDAPAVAAPAILTPARTHATPMRKEHVQRFLRTLMKGRTTADITNRVVQIIAQGATVPANPAA